jgi:cytochrome bd ubiquinol oxidase subunit I
MKIPGHFSTTINSLYDWRWMHRAAVAMGPSGFVAVLAGWVTTEVGRQPFTIYGLLRTSQSASPLDAPAVALSLLAFVLVYFTVFGAGIGYLLKLMKKPPEAYEAALDGAPIRSAGVTPAPAVIEGAA